MYSTRGVAITDGVNRKNHIMPLSTLMNAYLDSYKVPMIMNLGHDRSKPIGYTKLNGIYMEPGKAYLVNSSNFPDNDEEQEILFQMVSVADIQNFYVDKKEEVDRLYGLLGESVTKNARIAPTGQAVAVIDEGIVARVFPDIQELLQDGLIDLRELTPVYKSEEGSEDETGMLVPGVYKKDQFLLFAHLFFRRNLCVANTLNDVFFDSFEKLRKNEGLQLKVAIDMNMIGLAGTESLELEYQYWWGPRFNDDLKSIPTGVTCYKNERYDNLFTNITDTQFYWHVQDDISTFECEEICDKENAVVDKEKYFGCRYVHSMVNQQTELPYHLDGAIRLYTDEQILERMDEGTDISKYGKNSLYFKLWRIDCDLNVSTWKELITHYFRDNQLIGEYFGGVDETLDQIKREKQEEKQTNTKNRFIPVNLNSGDGLRIFFKYVDKKEIPSDRDALVKNSLMLTMPDGKTEKILEADAITFLKLLISKGVRIRKPITSLVDFGDMVFNYPYICCKDAETSEKVLSTILELCHSWKDAGDDRLLTFGVVINRENKEAVQLSFAGHVDDYVEVLDAMLPLNGMEIEDWVLQLYEKNNKFREAKDYPDKFLLLHDDSLQFERRFVSPKEIGKVWKKDGRVSVDLRLPKEEAQYLYYHKVNVSPAYKIKEAICTKCGQEYRYCPCMKFICKDVSDKVTKADYLGMVWTKRSSYFPDDFLHIGTGNPD